MLAMISFNVNTAKLDAFIAKVAKGVTNVGGDPNLSSAFDGVGRSYLAAMRRRFTINAAGGGDWPELSPVTLAKKLPKGVRRSGILKVTQRLYRSLFPTTDENILQVNRRGVTVGTAVPYATYHQNGTRTIPQRTILVNPDKETLDVMQKRVAQGFRGLFKDARSN